MRLLWREDVSASEAGDGTLVIENSRVRLTLRPPAPAFRQALLRFAPPGEEEELLTKLVADGNGGLSRWYYYLEHLNRRGLVSYSVHAGDRRLATLVPMVPAFRPRLGQLGTGRYVLSRFAYLRRQGDEAVVESPLAHARIVLNDSRAAAVVGCLAAPASVNELAGRVPDLGADSVAGLLSLLLQAGMIQETGRTAATAEDLDAALQTWEFHDLLFHARSRKGRHDSPFGGTYRCAGRSQPPPALKPVPAGEIHELYRPELSRLECDDPSLTRVLEERCSVRAFDGERPITERQLGEFLFRVARVRRCHEMDTETPAGPIRMEMASRPYPAGGGLYELEFYLAINTCAGLSAGLYYYDPAHHRLIALNAPPAKTNALLADVGVSTGIPQSELQVLIILAARFPRIAWKYQAIAYALTLKHVGVVYQTMYLAATAMSLGPCAVGGGDADLFAQAAGTDYVAETSVGEFLLGSKQTH